MKFKVEKSLYKGFTISFSEKENIWIARNGKIKFEALSRIGLKNQIDAYC